MNLEKEKNEWDNILKKYGNELMGFDLKNMSDEELDRVRYFGTMGGSLRGIKLHQIEIDLTHQEYERQKERDNVDLIPKYGPGWTTDLKIEIRIRDSNRCLNPECSRISTKLIVHHIDYDGYNNDKTNLITVCNSCNNKAKSGTNYSEWWASWYNAIMYRRGNL